MTTSDTEQKDRAKTRTKTIQGGHDNATTQVLQAEELPRRMTVSRNEKPEPRGRKARGRPEQDSIDGDEGLQGTGRQGNRWCKRGTIGPRRTIETKSEKNAEIRSREQDLKNDRTNLDTPWEREMG